MRTESRINEELSKMPKLRLAMATPPTLTLALSSETNVDFQDDHRFRQMYFDGYPQIKILPTLSCVNGIPGFVFTCLELGGGTKVLSRGRTVDIPIIRADYTVNTELIVARLLHNVDTVLGMA